MKNDKLGTTLQEARILERKENEPKEKLGDHILELSHLKRYMKAPHKVGSIFKAKTYYCPVCEKQILKETVNIGTSPFGYFHCDCGYEYVPTQYLNF